MTCHSKYSSENKNFGHFSIDPQKSGPGIIGNDQEGRLYISSSEKKRFQAPKILLLKYICLKSIFSVDDEFRKSFSFEAFEQKLQRVFLIGY